MPVLGAYQTSEVLLGNLQVDRKKNLPELGSETLLYPLVQGLEILWNRRCWEAMSLQGLVERDEASCASPVVYGGLPFMFWIGCSFPF